MKPLIVVPTYVTDQVTAMLTRECLASLASTVFDKAIIALCDDASPYSWLTPPPSEHVIYENEENRGFSQTINNGLRKALEEGRDAILVNADVSFPDSNWLDKWEGGDQIEGALLVYPGEPQMVQHAGILFSPLRREFDHLYRHAPVELPKVHERRICPVTAALMRIPCEVLEVAGLFDTDFELGWEDVSYCLDAYKAGFDCVYNPKVLAVHHESMFRSFDGKSTATKDIRLRNRQIRSLQHLWKKHAGEDFSWVPTGLEERG